MDYNNLKVRAWMYVFVMLLVSGLSYLMCTTFDETEIKVIGGVAIGLAGMLFGMGAGK